MKGKYLIILLFLAASTLLIILHSFFPFSFINGAIQKTWIPLAMLRYNSLNPSTITENELAKLKRDNIALQKKLAEYESIKKDNIALRNQFSDSSLHPENLILARVIGYLGDVNNPHSLFIDKGSFDGIKDEMLVIMDDIAVGKIRKTSDAISLVMLVVNKDFNLIGRTAAGNAIGLIKGEEDFILFDNIPITDDMQKEDLVVTKGESDNNNIKIKDGIIVGKITSINKSESKPFQNAKIAPLIDYSKIQVVFVIIK